MKKVNIADFKTRWDYTKATSRWHFDPQVDEDKNPPYLILGHFKASFTSIVADALAMHSPTTFNNRLRNGQVPFTAPLEAFEMQQAGLSADHVLINEVRQESYADGEWPELIQQIIAYFGFQKRGLGAAIHVQNPGQVFPLHIDVFPFLKQNQEHHILDDYPDEAARFTIQLEDWKMGQVWGFGNTYWKQWRAGEIAFHSWRDLPHFTANGSFVPRVSLQVTGIVTERTRQLIATARERTRSLPEIDPTGIVVGS
jgi:hypothetical protein